MRYKLDHLDARILEHLRENARTPYVHIAKELGVSEGMVRQRVKRMLEEGIIRRFTTVVQSHGIKAVIEVGVGLNVHTTKVAMSIRDLRGVECVYEVSGDMDIVAVVNVENTAELNDIIESIRSMKNVTSTKTRLVLKEV